MAEHPNVELLRKGIDAFSRGDVDTGRSLWADDVVYHVPGAGPLAGDHKGKDGVLAYLAKAAELAGGTLRMAEVHDVLANDEHGVALLRFTATRKGRQFTWNQANVYHLRNGKMAEAWALPADHRAVDEFFS
jgi:ketosteroid isomerase-like protein